VQTVIPLSASKGAMRLTTSRYFTPSGRSIQAEGIEPNIVVEQAKLEEIKETGSATTEASLRKHLKNGNKEKDAVEKTAVVDKSKTTEKKTGADGEPTGTTDYQLGRALDLLRGIHIFSESKM
jgi:carboxyl-terminal processing protease